MPVNDQLTCDQLKEVIEEEIRLEQVADKLVYLFFIFYLTGNYRSQQAPGNSLKWPTLDKEKFLPESEAFWLHFCIRFAFLCAQNSFGNYETKES